MKIKLLFLLLFVSNFVFAELHLLNTEFISEKQLFENVHIDQGLLLGDSVRRDSNFIHLFNVTASTPFASFMTLKPSGEKRLYYALVGGFSGGIECFYKKDRFVSLVGGIIGRSSYPFSLLNREKGRVVEETIYNFYLSGTHNFVLNRTEDPDKYRTVGFGLAYQVTGWSKTVNHDTFIRENIEISSSLGATINLYVHLWRPFYGGLIIRPTILRIEPKVELKYELIFGLDLLVRM